MSRRLHKARDDEETSMSRSEKSLEVDKKQQREDQSLSHSPSPRYSPVSPVFSLFSSPKPEPATTTEPTLEAQRRSVKRVGEKGKAQREKPLKHSSHHRCHPASPVYSDDESVAPTTTTTAPLLTQRDASRSMSKSSRDKVHERQQGDHSTLSHRDRPVVTPVDSNVPTATTTTKRSVETKRHRQGVDTIRCERKKRRTRSKERSKERSKDRHGKSRAEDVSPNHTSQFQKHVHWGGPVDAPIAPVATRPVTATSAPWVRPPLHPALAHRWTYPEPRVEWSAPLIPPPPPPPPPPRLNRMPTHTTVRPVVPRPTVPHAVAFRRERPTATPTQERSNEATGRGRHRTLPAWMTR